MHRVDDERPRLDEALLCVPRGAALVWSPDKDLLDCDVVEYSPEPVRLELVTTEREP